MLIKKDVKNNKNSVYKCDRCKRECGRYKKVSIGIDPFCSGWKKKYDLCTHCYKLMCKRIESFSNNQN